MFSYVYSSVSAASSYTPFSATTRFPQENEAGPSDLSIKRCATPHASLDWVPSSDATPSPQIDADSPANAQKYRVIHEILRQQDFYDILDVPRACDTNALRRAYMKRCKACHPDKYPSYPLATVAFQKVSFVYNILSQPSSRRSYDINGLASFNSSGESDGFTHPSYSARADETLSGVLLAVFFDFMDGDFQMIRTFLRAMSEVNPALNMQDDTVESLLSAFARLREVLLTGRQYVRIIRFELIRMYEIQHSLRQLSYFDICGRMRLTLQLARITLSLPCTIDRAMLAEAEQEEAAVNARAGKEGTPEAARKRAKRLLHPRVNSMLLSVCGVLEFGERVL